MERNSIKRQYSGATLPKFLNTMKPGTRKLSIPQEIIFEIFSWLPAQSLMRFKCVSRFCNSLVSESAFVDIHQRRSMTRTGGIKFVVRQASKLYTIDAMEDGKASRLHIENFYKNLIYQRIMCANGLFCCKIKYDECVAICNPSTKVVRFLPRPKDFAKIYYQPEYFYSIGFDPQEKTHKVLMTANQFSWRLPTRSWIFSLGIDKSWREIKGITNFAIAHKIAVYIDGFIYMLCYTYEGKSYVVAFDVKNETSRVITLWNSSEFLTLHSYNITKVNGKLAILDVRYLYSGENMDLWILGNEEWEKHIIEVPQQWKDPDFELPECCGSCDGEILFTKTTKSRQSICFCYDVMRKRWRNFKIQGLQDYSSINVIYSYAESLFPLEKYPFI